MTLSPARPDLADIAGNPRPKGIEPGTLRTADGIELRYAVTPSQRFATRGTILLLQGRNEAIEKYFETIEDLSARGYCVLTFDWRGQGGSQRVTRNPAKGHITHFDAYFRDFEAVFRDVALPDCRGPYAVLAHSMGAAVAILGAKAFLNRIERIVASAPLVALAGARPRTNQFFVAANLLRWTGFSGLPVRGGRGAAAYTPARNPLTSDRHRFERNRRLAAEAPHLFVNGPTAGWLAAATGAMRRLDDSDVIAELHVPTLIVTAGADAVVSSAAAERLGWRMRSGHVLALPEARHELLQEADRFRAPFLAAADAFIGGAMPEA
ncbi:lysophospholipase [Aureimonas endophytica]|uniref:Lysophospholipase n=1 Tax=Aureimonas endophytica TaxID=2027858 RepID=A0A916ZGY8_9HYPH|nr:alpha/beta hydrolase [Aureimonas endophytica]GGD95332.1 lysophospholipase [Aureimonas endophytica]